MPRPRKSVAIGVTPAVAANMSSWAESLGEALGRGVARGINSGLSTQQNSNSNGYLAAGPRSAGARRRGRSPAVASSAGAVAADRRCQEPGCNREARSKGLCSAHYQAARRRQLKNA